MANVKITELTAATALAGTDVLPIVDVGADATKKVSVSDLLRNLPDGTATAPALAFADDQNTGVLSPGNNSLAFATSGTQRLVIDSSGNIGINETSPGQRLVVGGDMRIGFTTPTDAARSLVFDSNRSSAGATLTNITFNWNSTAVSQIRAIAGADTTNKDDGELAFFTSAANSILERLRIDSSGKVGIGTTSPNQDLTISSGADKLHLFGSTAGNGGALFASNSAYTDYEPLSLTGERITFSTRTGTFTSSERMRIDSSGRLLVGGSATVNSSGGAYIQLTGGDSENIKTYRIGTGTREHLQFYNGASNSRSKVGSISTSGSSTAFNTSSDYRLKENVVDLDGAIIRVKQLSPKRFNFIVDADTTVDGFLAHEAATVVPEAVTGTHNEVDSDNNPVYQGIDLSKLVPLLTAALQEAIAKIETLETKVAALEAQ